MFPSSHDRTNGHLRYTACQAHKTFPERHWDILLVFVKLCRAVAGRGDLSWSGRVHAYVSGGQCPILSIPLHTDVNHGHDILQILLSAWPTRTTSSVLDSRRHTKFSEHAHLRLCSCFAPCCKASTLLEFPGIDDTPIPEFSVVNTSLTSGQTEVHHAIDGPSIAIIARGKDKYSGPMAP